MVLDQGAEAGWAAGPEGARLWGKFGAAGLLLVAHGRVLMQHRATWTAQGGTWALPGGAKGRGETATQAALRECVEETGIDPEKVTCVKEIVTAGPYPFDPDRPDLAGGWTYTTVIATAQQLLPTVANEESEELEWVEFDHVEELNLLPAFAAAWPLLLGEIAAL